MGSGAAPGTTLRSGTALVASASAASAAAAAAALALTALPPRICGRWVGWGWVGAGAWAGGSALSTWGSGGEILFHGDLASGPMTDGLGLGGSDAGLVDGESDSGGDFGEGESGGNLVDDGSSGLVGKRGLSAPLLPELGRAGLAFCGCDGEDSSQIGPRRSPSPTGDGDRSTFSRQLPASETELILRALGPTRLAGLGGAGTAGETGEKSTLTTELERSNRQLPSPPRPVQLTTVSRCCFFKNRRHSFAAGSEADSRIGDEGELDERLRSESGGEAGVGVPNGWKVGSGSVALRVKGDDAGVGGKAVYESEASSGV